MKFKSKASQVTYAIICVIASAALIGLIIFILTIGKKYDAEIGANANLSKTDTSRAQSDSSSQNEGNSSNDVINYIDNDSSNSNDNSQKKYSSETSDTVDTYVMKDGMKSQDISTSSFYEIYIPYGNVTFTATDKKSPYVEYSDLSEVELLVQDNNGETKIDVNMPKRISNLLKDDTNKFKMNFYLPKETLEKLDLEINAGNVNINNINANLLELDVNAGNCVINKCELAKFDADVDAGNIEFSASINTKTVDIDVDAGNAKLLLPTDVSGFKLDYEVDLGNFTNRSSFKTYSSNNGLLGKKGIILFGDELLKLKLDVNVGNITLDNY